MTDLRVLERLQASGAGGAAEPLEAELDARTVYFDLLLEALKPTDERTQQIHCALERIRRYRAQHPRAESPLAELVDDALAKRGSCQAGAV